ncbi:MAG: YkgJ family cysteine cluster protein [Desulfovibrio sp.]|nr:YkgJ family cysteine cluster protein [Desulfovibrio sp.]
MSEVFDCKMCGSCCEGTGGIVVSPKDLNRLASYLAISEEQVIERYAEYVGSKLKLRNAENGCCIFFAKDQGCQVHAGKPDICRAWPFFRGNLIDAESFAMAKEYCPGIKQGVSHQAFVEAGYAYLSREDLVAHDGTQEANALILQ